MSQKQPKRRGLWLNDGSCIRLRRNIPATLGPMTLLKVGRFVTHEPPAHIRSDNGPRLIANAVQEWLAKISVKTFHITPGSPWGNSYCASLNGSIRDEFLNGELFYTLAEAQILIEAWRRDFNESRPHTSLGFMTPAEFPSSAGVNPSR
jgi:putative transposase